MIDRRPKSTNHQRFEQILHEAVGTAFSARKQLTHENVPTIPVKQSVTAEAEEDETEEKGSLDELSDEDIDFVNYFEALRESAPSATPSKKKLKKKASATELNGKLSTCDRNRIETLDEETLKVTLLPDEIITVCGEFLLSVVQGSVSILGAKIAAANPSVYHPVYAPRSHSLPIITGLKSKKTKSQVSILYLKNYRSGISQLDGICPFAASLFDSPPTTGSLVSRPKDLTFSVLGDSPAPLARTQYPLSWQEAFQTISSATAPSILVCGQKGIGKSTFCQFLGNSFIRRRTVMYLETDPGQPSYSPPGLVSLHSINRPNLSPPFVRSGMCDLVRSHHIGNISPRDNPRHYINCIADLLSHDPRTTPTIINTPGWTKGTGFELLTSLIENSKPNFIVVLAPEGNDSLARSLHPFATENQSHILVLESANTLAPALSLTAAEFRALGIMSYFHQIGFEKWDFKTHLTAWKPWVVKFSGPATDRGLHAIAIQGEELLLDDIVCAVNATMVAIILVSTTSDEEVTYTAEGIPVLSGRETPFMEPQRARCVGYAFIRGIDSKRGELLMLSPWDPSSLQKGESVVLERGRVNLPVWGMWDHENPRKLGPWLERA